MTMYGLRRRWRRILYLLLVLVAMVFLTSVVMVTYMQEMEEMHGNSQYGDKAVHGEAVFYHEPHPGDRDILQRAKRMNVVRETLALSDDYTNDLTNDKKKFEKVNETNKMIFTLKNERDSILKEKARQDHLHDHEIRRNNYLNNNLMDNNVRIDAGMRERKLKYEDVGKNNNNKVDSFKAPFHKVIDKHGNVLFEIGKKKQRVKYNKDKNFNKNNDNNINKVRDNLDMPIGEKVGPGVAAMRKDTKIRGVKFNKDIGGGVLANVDGSDYAIDDVNHNKEEENSDEQNDKSYNDENGKDYYSYYYNKNPVFKESDFDKVPEILDVNEEKVVKGVKFLFHNNNNQNNNPVSINGQIPRNHNKKLDKLPYSTASKIAINKLQQQQNNIVADSKNTGVIFVKQENGKNLLSSYNKRESYDDFNVVQDSKIEDGERRKTAARFGELSEDERLPMGENPAQQMADKPSVIGMEGGVRLGRGNAGVVSITNTSDDSKLWKQFVKTSALAAPSVNGNSSLVNNEDDGKSDKKVNLPNPSSLDKNSLNHPLKRHKLTYMDNNPLQNIEQNPEVDIHNRPQFPFRNNLKNNIPNRLIFDDAHPPPNNPDSDKLVNNPPKQNSVKEKVLQLEEIAEHNNGNIPIGAVVPQQHNAINLETNVKANSQNSEGIDHKLHFEPENPPAQSSQTNTKGIITYKRNNPVESSHQNKNSNANVIVDLVDRFRNSKISTNQDTNLVQNPNVNMVDNRIIKSVNRIETQIPLQDDGINSLLVAMDYPATQLQHPEMLGKRQPVVTLVNRDGVPVIVDRVYWSQEVEALVPPGLAESQFQDYLSAVAEQPITKLDKPSWRKCGRPKNQVATLSNGQVMCARYRENHSKMVQGELLSFYLSRFLALDNIPPVVLTSVTSSSTRWAAVSNNIVEAGWLEGNTVALIMWIDQIDIAVQNYHPNSKMPSVILNALENNSSLTWLDLDVASLSANEMSDLVQWSDLIVFDYITGNYDRIASMQDGASKENKPSIMHEDIRNLRTDPVTGKLWFIDNEGGLLDAYELIYSYQHPSRFYTFHAEMLRSICVFHQQTIDRVRQLAGLADPAEVLLMYAEAQEPVFKTLTTDFRGYRYFRNNFVTRLKDVVQWVDRCAAGA